MYHEDFAVINRARTFERAVICMRPGAWGMGYEAVVTADNPDPQKVAKPGSVAYDLQQIGGAPSAGLRRYILYDGSRGAKSGEMVMLAVSKDDKIFSWISVDDFNHPILIPDDAKTVRFELNPGGTLEGFDLIGVSGAK